MAISYSAKVLKFVESKQQGGNQLTISPLVSLEHPNTYENTSDITMQNYAPYWSVLYVLALENGNHTAESVTTTKLLLISAVLSVAGSPCLSVTLFHVPLPVPICALKFPKRIVHSVEATL